MTELPSDLPVGPEIHAELSQILPAEQVFLSDTEPAAAPSLPLQAVRLRLPGPGLLESLAWMAGLFVAQTAGSVGLFVLLVATQVWTSGTIPASDAFAEIFAENIVAFAGVSGLATLIYGIGGVALRSRPRGLRRLGWHAPAAKHLLLTVLLFLPLSLLCSEWQNLMFQFFPSSEEQLKEALEGMRHGSLFEILLVVAVFPAFGEELIFRGLIGRGLVARWGLTGGVLLTSILFGVVHVIPAQAIAVIPLGMAMHFLYLTTKSFWAPVLLHFLNNAFAVLALKFSEGLTLGHLFEDAGPLPPELLCVCMTVTTGIFAVLWETRVRYTLNGAAWDPGYPTLELPPPDSGISATSRSAQPLVLAGSTFCLLGFIAVVCRLAAGS